MISSLFEWGNSPKLADVFGEEDSAPGARCTSVAEYAFIHVGPSPQRAALQRLVFLFF
jgi:hypothetical protein